MYNEITGWGADSSFGGGRSLDLSNNIIINNNLPMSAWTNISDNGFPPINGMHISSIENNGTVIDILLQETTLENPTYSSPALTNSINSKTMALWHGNGIIFFSRLLKTSNWTPPNELTRSISTTQSMGNIKAVMDSNGNSFATWLLFDNESITLWHSRYVASMSSWSKPTQLSKNSISDAPNYDLLMTKSGFVKVVWSEPSTKNNILIEATFN